MFDEETLAHLTEVQTKYLEQLMALPHVVGVGIGYARVADESTEQAAIVVMVDAKIPMAQLAVEEAVPHELEGVRVDVQAVGNFSA